MKFKAVKCPGCGADVDYDPDREFMFCQYCGTKIVIEDDARVELKKLELEKHKFDTEQKNKEKEELKNGMQAMPIVAFIAIFLGIYFIKYESSPLIGALFIVGGIVAIVFGIKYFIDLKNHH